MNQKSNKVTFKFTDNQEQDSEYEYISALAKEFHQPSELNPISSDRPQVQQQ